MYTFKDFIRCINHWLSEAGKQNDWKRITYTAFLTQYDIHNQFIFKKATKYIHNGEPISRTRFFIGEALVVESEDIDDIPEEDATGEYNIPKPVEERVKMIVKKHYSYKNWQISLQIRNMLNLSVEKWRDYRGMDIDEYLYSERYRLRHREI
jgi:hypothetical protein